MSASAKVHAIIPARLNSSRLSKKVLRPVNARPVLAWLIDDLKQSGLFSSISVASDSEEVLELVERENCMAVPILRACRHGTQRVAHAAKYLGLTEGFVLNIQGDQLGVDTLAVAALIKRLEAGDVNIATLARPCVSLEEYANPNRVKLVCNEFDEALYFSRSPMPFGGAIADTLIHVGVYGFDVNTLYKIADYEACRLSTLEDLEQLEWLCRGHRISICRGEGSVPCIDDEGDLKFAKAWLKNRRG